MNGYEFNKMTNKEKMDFIVNNNIEVIMCGRCEERMFFYYNKHKDLISIESEITQEYSYVKSVEYCGNNQLKVILEPENEEVDEYIIYLDCFIYKKAFNEDDILNGVNDECK